MVSIILLASDDVKEQAKAAGFKEQTVLIRHNPVISNAENKATLERELFKMKPFQFLVSDFWGMGVE